MKNLNFPPRFYAVFLGLLLLAGCNKDDSLFEPGKNEPDQVVLKSVPVSGTISAQYNDSPSGEEIDKVYDNNVYTKYLTFHNTVWIQWKGSKTLLLQSYAISSANDFATRDPKSWKLYGSNNGTTWTQIDQRSNQTFSARYQRKEYVLSSKATFSFYKLEITQNNGASITQLSEWDLIGEAITPVATVYQHCWHGGYEVNLAEGNYKLSDLQSLGILNNDLSSVKVTSGYKITLYDGDNFTGDFITLTSTDDCIVDNGFNDRTTSLKVEKIGIVESIDDLMGLASGSSYSSITPMGNHYEGLHVTTDADRAWLNNASNQAPVPPGLASSLHLANFSVTLYPYGSPSPADINQHNIGDCGAIAALASMAYIVPDFVKSLITDNHNGTYSIAMFDPQGKPVTVAVDSKFLADGNGNLAAVSGKNSVACWSTILEKAVMKYNVIYKANNTIEGIGSEHVPPLFTGNGNSFAFNRNVLTPDELARVVRVCLAKGKFIVGGFGQVLPIGNVQTVTGHAYTITISADHNALFSMRNPWGVNPLASGGYETSTDGVLNIPTSGSVPATIDLRIIDPGIAGTAGTTSPYIPPVQALKSTEAVRISERLLKNDVK
ncbi:MAG: hypothetical protein JXB34_14125 [Bacteroidales bacterium]|nr:hypothetical protein [Bacteroidales bacterium]